MSGSLLRRIGIRLHDIPGGPDIFRGLLAQTGYGGFDSHPPDQGDLVCAEGIPALRPVGIERTVP